MDKVVNEEYDLKEQIRINEVMIEENSKDLRSMELFSDAYGTPEEVSGSIFKLKENIEKRREQIALYKNKQLTWDKSREVESKIVEIQTEQFLLDSELVIGAANERFHLINNNLLGDISTSERSERINGMKQELLKLHAEFTEMCDLYM